MTCTICIVILFVGQNPGCIGRSLLQRDNPIKKKKKKKKFLCKYNVQVDFGQGSVTIRKNTAKLSSPGMVTCLAKSVVCVVVPKQHELRVPVTCTRKLLNKIMLFSKTKRSHEVNEFTVTDTITTVRGSNAYVRVVNKSPDVITIPKGTVIAFGHPANNTRVSLILTRVKLVKFMIHVSNTCLVRVLTRVDMGFLEPVTHVCKHVCATFQLRDNTCAYT